MDQQSVQDECIPECQRTAFLIRCTETEAGTIRNQAKREQRSISGYVLAVLDRSIATERMPFERDFDRGWTRTFGTRTALLIRCSIPEADQIRIAARRRDMSIHSFALHCLRRSWNTERASDTRPSIPSAVLPSKANMAVKVGGGL